MGLLENILTQAATSVIGGGSSSSGAGSAIKKAATAAAAAAAVNAITKKIKNAKAQKQAQTVNTGIPGDLGDLTSIVLGQMGGSSSGINSSTITDVLGKVLGGSKSRPKASGMDIGDLANSVISVIGMANASK